ncbi:hypothetical protein BCR32DRAFT_240954 [Anaeromyces robustus]|uniref:CCHC-type domain-containing protein n=1 Tax=Anaeromyces robustus TaxID=1754192 RepID=A0A1Y1X054_9FUNG|nr:hypothetical protein BCR32DRAFT_246557 [Anaeromyces robustus]ORX83687.1 hypothetical protein BCR32DRAFT_243218 [Anaeromyces robustus]ORX86562.1 hypothetical protein BCR32DRAFT_240954 [Anaeromyces robustus]|eukprot:ORX79217.1 hypothetical protein BCR32DRAFT_246557 [Anaeromyces robustus]
MNFKIDSITPNSNIINSSIPKNELNSDYYPIWASDMFLLLSSYGLEAYICEENLKKVTKDDPGFGTGCLPVRGTTNLFYAQTVNRTMLRNDNKAKWFISSNLDNNNKRRIDFVSNTAYEVWKLLESTYQKGIEERKIKIKKDLEEMKYDKNDDFEMFLSNMNNLFNTLRGLNAEVSDEQKFNYLYTSLPSDITRETNMICYQDKWEDCCKMLLKTIPRLKFLKELKGKQNKINAFNNEYNKNRNKNDYYKYSKYNTKNKICYICHRSGHIARSCPNKNNNNKQKTEKFNNKKYKQKKYNYSDNIEVEKHNNKEMSEENVNRYNNIYDNSLINDYNSEPEIESNYILVNNESKQNNKNFQ